jgi:hypothetical protein
MSRHYHAAISKSGAPIFRYVSESWREVARWPLQTMRYTSKVLGLRLLRTNYDECRTVVRCFDGSKSACTIRTRALRHYGDKHGTQYELVVWQCYGDCLERAVPVG